MRERLKDRLKQAWELALEAANQFSDDRAELAAAALAFFALLSLAPLIVVAVAIASFVMDNDAARAEVRRLLTDTMGQTAADAVLSWEQQALQGGAVASVVGVTLMLLASSRLTEQLRSSLNQVWNVDVPDQDGLKAMLTGFLRRRAFALLVVLACGPLLLAVFISRAVLTGLQDAFFGRSALHGILAEVTQLAFSFTLVTALSTLIFRFIPDRRAGWTPCFRGAIVTSLLFTAGNYLVGLYLGRASIAAYGLAGSLVVVLLWLYYSAQIFLFGAEFAQLYAARHEGDRARPGQSELGKKHQSETPRADSVGQH